jgi:Asp/Glu/hydantoin racemase
MAEASVEAACRLGRRFAIVTGGAAWAPMLNELVTGLGRSDRLAAIRTIEQSGDEIARDPGAVLDRLVEACNACANQDGASSVILGGAGLAGLAARVQGSVPVPVICSVEAGARAALAARDQGRRARARSTVDSVGLSTALAKLLGGG